MTNYILIDLTYITVYHPVPGRTTPYQGVPPHTGTHTLLAIHST
ncbi:hypothetical protein PQ469_17635 [Mucilaginibacter sp. KACC 22773]|nr:hypothetical protein [Mucilaginibacter sp. KACC 22773]WDF75709.1 hypothetical protein PQ469_17635 [Mucilaginibacter sp. KACC 22773]